MTTLTYTFRSLFYSVLINNLNTELDGPPTTRGYHVYFSNLSNSEDKTDTI